MEPTKEDIRELYRMLPHDTMCRVTLDDGTEREDDVMTSYDITQYISGKTVLKPYLRPMSSMTEDEKREMKLALSPRGTATFAEDGIHMPMTHTGDFVPYDFMERTVEWLRERHFDINGLTGKGKAIPIFRIYRYDDVMNRI